MVKKRPYKVHDYYEFPTGEVFVGLGEEELHEHGGMFRVVKKRRR